jgi:hypothetical protein
MAAGALGTGTWSTGVPQQAGMWFQIELPAVTSISEVQFDSPGAAVAGRGGRGRGAAPTAGAAGAATPATGSQAAQPGGAPAASAAQTAPGPTGAAQTPVPAAPAPAAVQGFGGGRGFALPPPGFPRGYTVEVSSDGTAWTKVATGQGDGGTTVIPFKAVDAKFIKITQTATAENAPAWSIRRLRLYGPPK